MNNPKKLLVASAALGVAGLILKKSLAAFDNFVGTEKAKPKLTYFDIEGAAEKIRLAFDYYRIDYEDDRIRFSDWEDIKPTTPAGQVPILTTTDGKILTQSQAILRWVGRQGDSSLYPENNRPIIDEALGLGEDFARNWDPCFYVLSFNHQLAGYPEDLKEDDKKAAIKSARAVFLKDHLPKHLKLYADFLRNKGGDYLCGDSVSIADLFIFSQLRQYTRGYIDHMPTTCLEDVENSQDSALVLAWMDRMYKLFPGRYDTKPDASADAADAANEDGNEDGDDGANE